MTAPAAREGMRIGVDGRYDIPIDIYHHDPHLCAGPSVSASALKAIADCPAKYWAFSPYNPQRLPALETKALSIGRAAHALVLGEPAFAAYFVISPFDDFRKKEAQEWRDGQTKTILKAGEFETVRAMAAAQRDSPHVANAFTDGTPEVSLIWKDQETGIWLKSRPDWVPEDPRYGFVVDYKTAASIEPRKLSSDVFKFGYHVQAAMQIDAVRAVFGIDRPLGIAHVVQEKDPPYLADLRMFPVEALDYGRTIYRRALCTFADCMASGKWPAYTVDPQFFSVPIWVSKTIEEDDDGVHGHGGTPATGYSASDYYGAG